MEEKSVLKYLPEELNSPLVKHLASKFELESSIRQSLETSIEKTSKEIQTLCSTQNNYDPILKPNDIVIVLGRYKSEFEKGLKETLNEYKLILSVNTDIDIKNIGKRTKGKPFCYPIRTEEILASPY